MKTLTIVALVASVAAALGVAIVYTRGRRALATIDPNASAAAPVAAVMTAGVESLKSLVTAVTNATTATPIDQSTDKNPARTDVAANYTEPAISRRKTESALTQADLATAGLYLG